ncbi:hypothetical protein BpHYR1_041037 [Brachionus plicatilis]|uniref:Uncharacterized protein n=1 Tax=Brachionus plicatilis TaxID=10195 RepID=A0A3M7Q0M5_BRAPC|nr:hypothetical protein BpHYR1_041037 [Brachionus plicatilis]
MYLRTFSGEKTLISTSCWVHAIGWRGLARHDATELDVENVRDLDTIRVEGAIKAEEAFDRVSALLLAVYIIIKKLWLKLTGPDNRRFELTDGVAHCCFDLFAHRGIE